MVMAAKREAEFDDDSDGDQRALFIDTTLHTHLVLLVSHLDTISILKQKILVEHPKCFPDFGEITVNALKVKRRGRYYHLLDSMLVRTAFHGVAKNWFLFADVSSPIASSQMRTIGHAIAPASKQLKLTNDCNKDDRFGPYSYNMDDPEMPKRFDPSRVHYERKSMEGSLEPGGSGGSYSSRKRRRRKRNIHDAPDENDATNLLRTEDMREMEHAVPKRNAQFQQQGINYDVGHKTLYVEHPGGDDDAQRSGLLGWQNTIAVDDDGKTYITGAQNMLDTEIQKDLHFNSKGKEPPATENHLKSVGDSKKLKNCADDEALIFSPTAKKKRKVLNNSNQEMPLLETRSLFSDPPKMASEPETVVNRSDEEDMQKSRLVDLNGSPSKLPKNSKSTRKRKMEERDVDCKFAYSEIKEKENLKDTGNFARNASAKATLPVHAENGSNNLIKDVQAEAHQLEGPTTSVVIDNENRIDNVGLACGPRAKISKKSKKGDVDEVNRSHPITSSEVLDTLKHGVAPLQNENVIYDSELDSIKDAEAGTTVLQNDAKLLSQHEPLTPLQRERETEDDIVSLKSLDMKGLEPGKTPKKRKTNKTKNSVKEKQEFCGTDNHQDAGNHSFSKGAAEYQNKDDLRNEDNSGENPPQTEGSKATNEIVELGSMAKKKKGKKGKLVVTENPDLSSMENIKDVNNYSLSNGPAEDQNKEGLKNEGNSGEIAPPAATAKATDEIVELGGTAKKKKVKKGKKSIAEEPDLLSVENNKDVGNHTFSNGPAENQNKDCPTNEGNSGENAPLTVAAKATDESVELGGTAKKKKVEKGKNSIAEKAHLLSMENNKDVGNHTFSNGPAENQNKDCLTNEANSRENAPPAVAAKATDEILELGGTAKKKKVKKGKNSITEKPDLLSMEINKDVGNRTFSNGPAENQNKDCPTNEGNIGENAPPDVAAKATDEIVELEGTAKKKKVKKGKNYVTEKPELSSMENNKDMGNHTVSNGPEEDQNKDAPTNEGNNGEIAPKTEGAKATHSDVNGAKQQREPGEDHRKESNETPTPEFSASLAEVRKLDKSHQSKKKTKKLDLSSSVETSANGHNVTTLKKSRSSERPSQDVTPLQNDDCGTEIMRQNSLEPLQPPQVNKPKENVEIRSDKPKKRTQKKQIVPNDPYELPMNQQLDDKLSDMDVPKPADGGHLTNSNINGAKHQSEMPPNEGLHEESNNVPPSEVSAGLTEVRSLNKPLASKEAQKLGFPSSLDSSSNEPYLTKLKKSKGSERTFLGVGEFQNSVTEQKHKRSMPQPSTKPPKLSQEHHANIVDSVAAEVGILNNQQGSAKKGGVTSASMHDRSKLTGVSGGKKAKEPQKKPDENHVDFGRSSHKNMGGVVNASAQRKGLLATSGAIFEDESSASSGNEDKLDGSDSSTRTPSDNLSSSDYSEGESKGVVVTSGHDSSKRDGNNNTNSKSSLKQTMVSILRSSSRYKKAKIVASQSQGEDGESEPVEFVPDSQPNL